VRKSSSVRLGILLAVAAVILACERERPPERRCVDGDGRFVDEAMCADGGAATADGGTARATGEWEEPDGGAPHRTGGFHFVWIPYGAFGGMGTYAPGYVRPGPGGPAAGPSSPGAVTRGGFGSTGAAHAAPSSSAGS
jgi:hypothetical protein